MEDNKKIPTQFQKRSDLKRMGTMISDQSIMQGDVSPTDPMEVTTTQSATEKRGNIIEKFKRKRKIKKLIKTAASHKENTSKVVENIQNKT